MGFDAQRSTAPWSVIGRRMKETKRKPTSRTLPSAVKRCCSQWCEPWCDEPSPRTRPRRVPLPIERLRKDIEPDGGGRDERADENEDRPKLVGLELIARAGVEHEEIGRASCRERVCQYV